ncbi:CotS family spore coat protein [Paenibacillus sp. 1011MAR3C5]|nr:CotS family spore coat protein [Paenibacillus sp. 1011MAR3C5]
MVAEESSGLNLEQYVPPELEKLAYQVCKSYNMDVRGMTLITSKPDKGGAIWRIDTNHGTRSLKVLHRTPARSLFSVGAQEYVVKQGARVPGIILTRDGKNSVVAGGKLWIVTDWIDTLTPVAKIDLEGAQTLCHGLGEFHKWSKGYVPPLEAGKSTRIFKWESQYQKIMTKIGWFRHIAKAYPDAAASPQLLSVLDTFENQAKEIFTKFQESSYQKMIRKGEAHWGLAHQDYGWSNGQMGPGGIWVIDLDGVAFDLPIRDLRKIITSTMDDMGAWDLAWIRGVIDAYHRANPLDRETFELLWIDMAFPNEFYKHVKEVVFRPVEFMDLELGPILDRVIATETNKWEVLRELEKDKAKYPAGDYTEIVTAPSQPYTYRDYAKKGRRVEGGRPLERTRSGSNIIRLVVGPDGKGILLKPGVEPGVEPGDVRKGKRSKRDSEPFYNKPPKKLRDEKKGRRKQKKRKSEEPVFYLPLDVKPKKEKAAKAMKPGKAAKAAKATKATKATKAAKAVKPVSEKLAKGKKLSKALIPQAPKADRISRPHVKRPTEEDIRRLRTEPARRAARKLMVPVKPAGKKKSVQAPSSKKKKGAIGKGTFAAQRTSYKKAKVKAYILAYRRSEVLRESTR